MIIAATVLNPENEFKHRYLYRLIVFDRANKKEMTVQKIFPLIAYYRLEIRWNLFSQSPVTVTILNVSN